MRLMWHIGISHGIFGIEPMFKNLLRCVAVCCGVLRCVTVCCGVLQYVAMRCRALQCVAVRRLRHLCFTRSVVSGEDKCVAVCCSVSETSRVTTGDNTSRKAKTS